MTKLEIILSVLLGLSWLVNLGCLFVIQGMEEKK